jgi:antiviral helicase SKI2
MQHEKSVLNENISQLKQLISDQNLQLLPDYEQRVAVLKELAFIDENSSVQLKGRVACEVGFRLNVHISAFSLMVREDQFCQ